MRDFISFHQDKEANEAVGNHRWMISYADFMTLLFVLFLVLYAKLPKHLDMPVPTAQDLHASLIPGIRAHHRIPPVKPVVPTTDSTADKQQLLLEELARTFTDLAKEGDITLEKRAEGVLLDVKDSALFASGTAQPAPQANAIVSKIADILTTGDNNVVVEGHTDSVPIHTAQYPSNWELSAARASSIVRALEELGISPDRLSASGYADTRPKSTNETVQGRSENRRVSLLVLNE